MLTRTRRRAVGIGYLSEENDLPGWMRVDELMRYSRAFRPGWDDAYAGELRTMFALDPPAKVKTLSKGQKARAGLVVALAYRTAEMWRFFEQHPQRSGN